MTAPTERRHEPDSATPLSPPGRLPAPPPPPTPRFIYYLDGDEYDKAMIRLSLWVEHVLLPTYGRETTSAAPWCPTWWHHTEAVAHLHALWMAWEELTGNPGGALGPANWHRDYLGPTMSALRDPAGPFAGCKAGVHRDKQPPTVAEYPGSFSDDGGA
ncbi:hypothetical protein Vqi01_01540 [Micromonospora qiuiae]|uniref:DUF4913 domain-containing protein n=1 Tax=Micromonospora qiuiae TaxID=502268 RepID=A0ABQ4J4F6_9ACTN|nr:DUF4913 domain-containing protein [Micromonospora qiuiae]GIJ24992.1 hypothetical protein Vqi01_01540 [Micromonospora qiuiae]